MFICKLCNKELGPKGISSHLRRQHNITNKEYYDKYLKKDNEGYCKICNKPTNFNTILNGYHTYCSSKCANLDSEIRNKIENTNLNRYGAKGNFGRKDISKKAIEHSQSNEAKQQRAKTNLDRYGAENPYASKIIIERMKQNNLDKYGVEYSGQRIDVKEKIKESNRKHFGVDYVLQSSEIKEKIKQSCIEKYGVTNPCKAPIIQEKIKNTNLFKYGTENVFANTQIKNKIKQTNIKRYGVPVPTQNKEIKNKTKINKRNYIAIYEQQNDCISTPTLINKYGHGWYQKPFARDIIFRHKDITYVKNSDIQKIIDYVEETGSHLETDIYQYIKFIYSGEIIRRCRKIITPQELDIYIPDKKIAIEVNGMYWHSEQYGTAKLYHFNKSKECQEKGIRLIHIYEWEWLKYPEKIKQLLNIALGTVNKIYARQCEVKEITNKEAKPFNEATHLQGHRAAQVTYGLFYKNELVQLMSFSKTKYNRNLSDNEWEIIRGCPGSNNIVIGGVSKLFKHFIEDYKPTKVFSYCDFNKFDGKSYLALGMSFIGYTGPNKWWLLPDYSVIERNPKKYQELKGNNSIWGSGSLKFVYTP